jgi:hypothetical protein
MKKRYIQDPNTLELIPADEYVEPVVNSPMVMPDIQPYRSQLDGSMVTSRSKHRELLKVHGCIEIGNETKYLRPKPVSAPEGLKQRIIDVVNSKL